MLQLAQIETRTLLKPLVITVTSNMAIATAIISSCRSLSLLLSFLPLWVSSKSLLPPKCQLKSDCLCFSWAGTLIRLTSQQSVSISFLHFAVGQRSRHNVRDSQNGHWRKLIEEKRPIFSRFPPSSFIKSSSAHRNFI